MNEKNKYSSRLDAAKYRVGDRVNVDGNFCQVIEVDHLQLSNLYLYVVRFDNEPITNKIVDESEIHE